MGRKLSIPIPLLMTNLEHAVIHRISIRPTTTLKLSKRARILLLGYEGIPYSVISRELGVRLNTVKSWQNRWISERDNLSGLETEADLTKGILLFFNDLPRSGKPKKFTMVQEKQIIALACDKPSNHNIELTDWSHKMLAKTAKSKGIVESISSAQVGRILKNRAIKTA
jgi:transposase